MRYRRGFRDGLLVLVMLGLTGYEPHGCDDDVGLLLHRCGRFSVHTLDLPMPVSIVAGYERRCRETTSDGNW
jgi:hypothetical protein